MRVDHIVLWVEGLAMTQAELAAIAERLTARGAPPQWLEKQFGAQGFTRSFYFRDLDGNVLEARSYD